MLIQHIGNVACSARAVEQWDAKRRGEVPVRERADAPAYNVEVNSLKGLSVACVLASTLAVAPAGGQTPPAAASPQTTPAADPLLAGVPMFPGAEFLTSYDAGRNQRQFLFGTNTPYAEVVAFYKTQFKSSGRELFRTPPMQQFDLARFQEATMAYQPSVVVKDYASIDGAGYLHVSGKTEKRYTTIIQIVPAAR